MCLLQVFANIHPFMKSHLDWVISLHIFGEAVLGAKLFLLKAAEHPVPNNQRTRVVFIKVQQVAAMMHPVVGWRIENVFVPARHPFYCFSMYPKLVEQAYALHHHHHTRLKANQRHPPPKKETPR